MKVKINDIYKVTKGFGTTVYLIKVMERMTDDNYLVKIKYLYENCEETLSTTKILHETYIAGNPKMTQDDMILLSLRGYGLSEFL